MIYCGFIGLNKIYFYNYFYLFHFTLLVWPSNFFKNIYLYKTALVHSFNETPKFVITLRRLQFDILLN